MCLYFRRGLVAGFWKYCGTVPEGERVLCLFVARVLTCFGALWLFFLLFFFFMPPIAIRATRWTPGPETANAFMPTLVNLGLAAGGPYHLDERNQKEASYAELSRGPYRIPNTPPSPCESCLHPRETRPQNSE